MTRSALVLRNKDVLAGLMFLAIAALIAYGAARLPLGTPIRLGSGAFPLLLAGTLGVLGAITLAKGLRSAVPEEMVRGFAWSRVAIVTAAVLFFVFTLAPLGFLPAIFGTTLIATFANRAIRPVSGLVLAASVSLVSWVLFAELLNLPFRALGSWFVN